VTLTSSEGRLTQIRYHADVGGRAATVVTELAPLADRTPITAPI
jgi:hypothetical protein